jgi:hypothetical protein
MKKNLVLALVMLLLTVMFSGHGMSNQQTSTLIQPQQLTEDFAQLYKDLKASHINLFVNVTEAEYDNEYKLIEQKLTKPLPLLQAHILFQRFVAFGKIGHANIGFPSDAYQHFRDNGGKAFPIYVEINDSRWFVDEDYSTQNLPKGTEITHINGRSVSDWLTILHPYIAADTLTLASSLLEFQLPQYLWLVNTKNQTHEEKARITVLLDGHPTPVEVVFLDRDTLQQRIELQPTEEATESDKLRDFQLLTDTIGYIKPGPFYNAENPTDVWNNEDFVAFVDTAFNHFIDNDVTTVVIDVRNNPGGTNSFSDPLIAWFADEPFKFASSFMIRSSHHAQASNQRRIESSPNDIGSVSQQLADAYAKNPHGSVFEFSLEEASPRTDKQFKSDVIVVMDRSSYSNAVSLAAIVQDYGFGKVIGEPSADFATTYASMETFSLTHTGIVVGFPKAHIIRPSGDTKAGPVYPDMQIDNITLGSIVDFVEALTPE